MNDQIEKAHRSRRPQRPTPLASPYVAGVPVHGKEFFGRNDVLNKIDKSLRQMGANGVVLYGARRTGKTSLLHKLRDGALGSGFVCVYMDMQAFAGASVETFVAGFLRIAREVIVEQRPTLAKDLSLIEREADFLSVLREYLKELLHRLKPVSLVLLLDEYEVLEKILATSELASQFLSLLEAEDNLYAILASNRKVETLKHKQFLTLLDTFTYIKLSFMDREDAVELIRAPAAGMLQYSDDAVENILALTAGHPFYIQLICQSIFDAVTSAGETVAKTTHVDTAVELFLQNPPPHLVLTWNTLTFDQEVAGVALANLQRMGDSYVPPDEISVWLKVEGFPYLRTSETEHSLIALRDIDWVEKQPQVNAYRLTMALVQRWILENRSIRDLAEKHLEDVLKKVPSYWRQMGAVFTDFVIITLIGAVITEWHSGSKEFTVLAIVAAVLGYFVVPIFFRRSTLGMRFWQLRVVRASTQPLERGRAILYGLLLSGRYLIILTASIGVYLQFFWKPSLSTLLMVVVAAAVGALDNLMVLFGRRRQGLCDKLVGTILIPAAIARE